MQFKRIYFCFLIIANVVCFHADAKSKVNKFVTANSVGLLVLDKTCGHTTNVSIDVDKPVFFKRLKLIAKKIFKNSPEFSAESIVYLEVFEKPLQDENFYSQPIFSGWLYASFPSINAFEHPIYSIKVVEASNED